MVKLFRKIVRFVKCIVSVIRSLLHFACTGKVMPVVTAFVFALLTCWLMYAAENQQSNLKEDAWFFHFLERFNKAKEIELRDTAFFVNVSHDIQLVYENPNRPSEGYAAITDRRKLLRFLQKIERDSVDYKYIMMDIRFEKGYETEYDDSLYAQIHRMPRLVIASHQKNDSGEKYEIADSILLDKCGMSDYNQYSIVTNFSRYTFLQEGKPSIALKMYDELNHQETSVKRWKDRSVYYSGNHLCINSPMMYLSGTVLDFESYMMLQATLEEERMQNGLETGMEAETAKLDSKQGNYYFYLNLGDDFVENEYRMGARWNGDLDNKVIIIANFEDDVHDTYVGKVSGAYITWMAYQYLCNGTHILSWGFILLHIFCFTFVFWIILFINEISNSKFADNEKALRRLSLIRWICTYLLLYVIMAVLYYFMKFRFNMAMPVLMMTVLNFMLQIANKYKKKR